MRAILLLQNPLLIHHVAGQFHSHEDPTHEEGKQDADECDAEQQDTIESGRGRLVRLVQHDESETAHGEEEAGRQSLHDVLTVDAVRHEGDGLGMAVLIGGGPDTGRLHDDIVDDAARDEEVGEQDDGEHDHRRWLLQPRGLLQFQVRTFQDGEWVREYQIHGSRYSGGLRSMQNVTVSDCL